MGRGKHFLIIIGTLMTLGVSVASAQSNFALDFDGDDYVEVPDPMNLDGPFTLEAWVLVRTATAGGRIISNRAGANGYTLDVFDDTSTIELRLALNGSNAVTADFTPYMNQWTHVAVTWAGSTEMTTLAFINGEQVGQNARSVTINPSPGNLKIGVMEPFIAYFDGLIDEVRIWSTDVDGGTIDAWRSRAVTQDHPDYDGLEGYWRFDEGSGQVTVAEIGSPALDGQLGSAAGSDDNDPAWVASGATPVREISVGQLKERYRE
jgi:hypothetical protein